MLVSLDAIREAAGRISGIARRTPVLDLSDLAGRPFLVKCESHQPGGAFKIRGATNMLRRLPADALRRGGLFRPETVERLIVEHENGRRDHRKKLYTLLAFQLWALRYLPA